MPDASRAHRWQTLDESEGDNMVLVRKMIKTLMISILFYSTVSSQDLEMPGYYETDVNLTAELQAIVKDLELDKFFDTNDGLEQISLAIIDLNGENPVLAGVNMQNFIYPASVYKMYVAAEILRQVSQGKYSLDSLIVVKSPNDVDRKKEIRSDPRPLLHDGDTVTVNYLLDLMITRSDNSAANCLIDLAQRENINKFILQYNWKGSEVTRKFLSRKYEDPKYKDIRGTETCALHAADFMYLINENKLENTWVSSQLKLLLGRQLDNTKYSQGLPKNTMFYHKTGWWSTFTHDVGIVDDGEIQYIIACFLPIEEENALEKFKALSERIHGLIRQRHQK